MRPGHPSLPYPASAAGAPTRRPAAKLHRSRQRVRNLAKSLDLLRLSVCAVIIVGVSTIQTFMGPVNALRPAFTATALACISIFMAPGGVNWSVLKEGWPAKCILAMFVIACGSIPFGISFGAAAKYMIDIYIRAVVPFFLMCMAIRNAKDLALFSWAYVISVGILVGLSFTVLEMRPEYGGLDRLQGVTTYDGNDLGMIFLTGLPLAILFFYNSGLVRRLISLAIIIGIPGSVALTGSRGAFLGLAVVGPALFLVLTRIPLWQRVTGVVIVAAGLAVAAPQGYWEQMGTLLSPSEDYNVSSEHGRVAIALRGLGYMARYPLFGVGLGNFNMAEGTISPLADTYLSSSGGAWIAPHNTYIQVGVELGAVALGIWLALLWGGSIGVLRLRKRIPESWDWESSDRRFLREMCLFLPISFMAFAVTTFFLSHAYTAIIYVLVAQLTGLVVLVRRELRKDARQAAGLPPQSANRPRVPR